MFGEQAHGEQMYEEQIRAGRSMGSKLDLEANARLRCLPVRCSRHLLRRGQPPFNAN